MLPVLVAVTLLGGIADILEPEAEHVWDPAAAAGASLGEDGGAPLVDVALAGAASLEEVAAMASASEPAMDLLATSPIAPSPSPAEASSIPAPALPPSGADPVAPALAEGSGPMQQSTQGAPDLDQGPVMPSLPPSPLPGVHVGLPCVISGGDVNFKVCGDDVVQQILPPRRPAGPAANKTFNGTAGDAPPRFDESASGSLALTAGIAPQRTPVPVDPRSGPAPAPAPRATDATVTPASPTQAWAAAAAAALLAPALLLAKLLASLLVRRRRGAASTREALLAIVRADPGVHTMELVRRSGLGNGTVQHHLRSLVADGEVVRVDASGHTCYFPPRLDPAVMVVRSAVRAATSWRIVGLLAAGPRSLSAIARDAGLAVSTVHYHVDKLRRAGAVEPTFVEGRSAVALSELGRRGLVAGADAGTGEAQSGR